MVKMGPEVLLCGTLGVLETLPSTIQPICLEIFEVDVDKFVVEDNTGNTSKGHLTVEKLATFRFIGSKQSMATSSKSSLMVTTMQV